MGMGLLAGGELTWIRIRLCGRKFAFTFVRTTLDPNLSGLSHAVDTRVCETILLTSLARTCLVAPLTGGRAIRALGTTVSVTEKKVGNRWDIPPS